MALSSTAQRIFDHLPPDGTKLSGGKIQSALSLSPDEYRAAREELKSEYLVVTGQGRGGTLGRFDTEEPARKPEPKKEVTKVERMAHAREVKSANSRERKRTAELKEIARDFMHEQGHTQVELRHVTFTGSDYEKPMIEVWDGPRAQIYTIEPLKWDMLRASRV